MFDHTIANKKILTNPPNNVEPTADNINNDLVIAKGDVLSKNETQRYMVISMLGTGTFGQVVRCIGFDGEEIAIKVVKNQPKYYHYEMEEVKILQKLLHSKLTEHFVEIKDVFMYKQHLCIVEELLGQNLYNLLRIIGFRGLDHQILRIILPQILEGMYQLSLLGIVHCDLKPENILIADYNTFKIKIIDFGSAMTGSLSSHFYVQSRYYRAPEVILGIPYGSSCDVWSFGCIAYELLVGLPLFPGKDNSDQIHRIYELFGGLPRFMLEHGVNSHLYFEKENGYKGRINENKITRDKVKEIIRHKHNAPEDNELFIKFIFTVLEPGHLMRPSTLALLNHEYFKVISSEPQEIPRRNQPNPVPNKNIRRSSVHETFINPSKKKLRNDNRKRSVHDFPVDNVFNNK